MWWQYSYSTFPENIDYIDNTLILFFKCYVGMKINLEKLL